MFKPDTFSKLRSILDRYHSSLVIGLGSGSTSPLAQAYRHNLTNEEGSGEPPAEPATPETTELAEDYLLANLRTLIQKQRADVEAKLEALMHQANHEAKFKRDVEGSDLERLIRENVLGGLRQKLRDLSRDVFSDWSRIVNTEVSNAVGLGSVDRILGDTEGRPASEVYVYRINPDDSRTCKYCRRFYIDDDGSPKLYRLATLLSNGSNYGKRAADWKPVSTSTHPNCRDSQVLELKPGWKLLPGGGVTFIGQPAWGEYLAGKLAG